MNRTDYINEKNTSKLKADLSKERYIHSINVMNSAVDLAKHYNADEEKSAIAGFFHDCAKYISKDKTNEMLLKYELNQNILLKNAKQLIHSYLGPYIARDEYGIEDEEILNAIKNHTTLNEKPTLLDKIIYLADVIEVGRDFEGIDEIRKLAYIDLDKAVLYSLEVTIIDLINKHRFVATEAVDARNALLLLCKN